MKIWALLAVIFLAFSLTSTTQSSNSYFFDFTKEADLLRDDGNWSTFNKSYTQTSSGFLLHNCWASVPHIYKGDLVATVKFELNVSAANLASMDIYLSASAGYEISDGYAGIKLIDLGGPNQRYSIFNGHKPDAYAVIVGNISPIPKVITNGMNELKIVKKGTAFEFWLNGSAITSGIVPPLYNSDQYCLAIWSGQDLAKKAIVYKSVLIEYDGIQTLR